MYNLYTVNSPGCISSLMKITSVKQTNIPNWATILIQRKKTYKEKSRIMVKIAIYHCTINIPVHKKNHEMLMSQISTALQYIACKSVSQLNIIFGAACNSTLANT